MLSNEKTTATPTTQFSKARVVGEIIDRIRKTRYIPDNQYGDLFDYYYNKSLTELIILNELYK